MLRTPEEYLKLYRSRGALWLHDGQPTSPHVELDSGLHSNGYANSRKVLTNPIWSDEAADDLVSYLRSNGLDLKKVNRVIGPQFGAITFAHDVARHISHEAGTTCLSGFTEKVGKEKSSPMKLGSIEIEQFENILLVEDVLTTGGSVERSAKAVIDKQGIILPFAGAIFNRSGLSRADGRKIISLIEFTMDTWPVEECPLCAAGSELITKPKDPENWARLTARS